MYCWFACISQMTNNVKHLLIYILIICMSLWHTCSGSKPIQKIQIFFYCWVVWILLFVDINLLSDTWFANTSSHLADSPSFCWWFPLLCSYLVWYSLICLLLLPLLLMSEPKKSTSRLTSRSLLPIFSSGILWFQNKYSSPYDPFWVNFCVWCEMVIQFHSLGSSFPNIFMEKTALFPLYIVSSFVINSLITHILWVYFLALSCVPFIYVSGPVPVQYCLDDYSFVI